MPLPNTYQSIRVDELEITKYAGFKGVIPPVMAIILGTQAQSSANFTTAFFTAVDKDYRVLQVKEQHDVAASDGSVDVVKTASGVAATSGTSVLSAKLPLTSTANTPQKATLSATLSNTVIKSGESLRLNATGLLSSLQGVSVVAILQAL